MNQRTHTTWTDDMTRTLKRLYASGADDKAIGAALGVTARAVLNRRSKLRMVKNVHIGKERLRFGGRAA